MLEQVNDFKNSGFTSKKYTIDILEFGTSKSDILSVESFLKTNFPDYEVSKRPLSINVCAHTGPGTIGVGYNLKIDAIK
ncbi:MAG TPA: hypothetical protein VJZ31_01425 [Bacilli bacterium]|nr:hypothetical protein [Bacilli bacterium]